MSIGNEQTSTQTNVYDVVEQEILDLIRQKVFGEALDSDFRVYFDVDRPVEGSLKRLQIGKSFMATNEPFVRSKTYTSMELEQFSTAFSSKEPIDTISSLESTNNNC